MSDEKQIKDVLDEYARSEGYADIFDMRRQGDFVSDEKLATLAFNAGKKELVKKFEAWYKQNIEGQPQIYYGDDLIRVQMTLKWLKSQIEPAGEKK